MSDKTPESEGTDPADVPVEDAAQDADEPTLVDETLDEAARDAVDGAPAARPSRRRSKAPVRRRPAAAEADDEEIEALEKDLGAGGGAATTTVTRRTSKAPVRRTGERKVKDLAEAEDDYGAVGPVTFVKQSAGELRKVVWPTWPELLSYFTAVLIFVLFFIAFVGLLDLFFGWGLLQLFGTGEGQ